MALSPLSFALIVFLQLSDLFGGVVAQRNQTVNLFKVANSECGQATLDAKFEEEAAKFANLARGTCSEHGYGTPAGIRQITVPVLGEITIQLFKKSSGFDVTRIFQQVAMGGRLEERSQCCLTCVAPLVKVYNVDTEARQCDERCMDPSYMWMARMMEANLSLADGTGCANLGFPRYNKTLTHGVGPLALSLDVYTEIPPETNADTVVLHLITANECAEATLDKKFAEVVEKYANFLEGSCVDNGYTVEEGSKELLVPLVGTVRLALYTQSSALGLVEGLKFAVHAAVDRQESLHIMMTKDVCGELQLDRSMAIPAMSVGGLLRGTCVDSGFTAAAGSQDLTIPTIGAVTVALFKQNDDQPEFVV